MQNNSNAPEEIFTWLNSFEYSDLPREKREIVDRFFSPGEYNDMFYAMTELSGYTGSDKHRKQDILSRFVSINGKGFSQGYRFNLLKVAAFFVPAVMVAALVFFFRNNGMNKDVALARTDTVFVARTGEPILKVVHDTVIRTQIVIRERPVSPDQVIVSAWEPAAAPEDLSGPGTRDMEEPENSTKNNSLREDTLWQLFPSVAM